MGLGDWIMATAQVKALHAETGRPVLILNTGGRVQYVHEVFANNPKIARTLANGVQVLYNAPGLRPYIFAKSAERWFWKRWNIQPGEIYLTGDEQSFGARYAGCILLEPHTKDPASNKAWIWERWQAVANRLQGQRLVQVGPLGTRPLDGVEFIPTSSFRQALSIVAAARVFVGTEGALHHAAAALGTQAVVLWSHYIDPSITGYRTQKNLRHTDETCGARVPCAECRASMARITVEEVLAAIAEVT